MGPKIADRKKQWIIGLLKSGTPYSKIVKAEGISTATISRIKREAKIELKPNPRGSKRIISDQTARLVAKKIVNEEFKGFVECHKFVTDTLKIDCSYFSTRKAIIPYHPMNLMVVKPLLTVVNLIVVKQESFYRPHFYFFTDETKVNRYGPDCRHYGFSMKNVAGRRILA